MITAEMYKKYLTSSGNTLSQVKRNQSDFIINDTFTADAAYKKVYILTKDGWKFEDAKYQFHTTPSILKDEVDYYLQFRPKVHYPIGSYVFIPDDIDFDINISGNELDSPLSLPDERITQLWFIVGRDNALSYVRYNVLKCNWKFKWMYNGKQHECWGVNRSANSYTSGKWTDEYSSSLDSLTAAWLPDTYHTYGNHIYDLHVCDTRTIMHEQRFMLTNNMLDPKVYQVTKITDLSPSGVIKLSIKQDELNRTTDNIELQICNYYNSSGETVKPSPEEIYPSNSNTKIKWMILNLDNELEILEDQSLQHLSLGAISYFKYSLPNPDLYCKWNIQLKNDNSYTEEQCRYYENLIKMSTINNETLSIKPGKAKSLIGKQFTLNVIDNNGFNSSSIDMEVIS